MSDITKINNGTTTYDIRDAAAVHRTGEETVTGRKLYTGGLVVKTTSASESEAPETNKYNQFQLCGSDGKYNSLLVTSYLASGAVSTSIMNRRVISGVNVDTSISLSTSSSGYKDATITADRLHVNTTTVIGAGLATVGMPKSSSSFVNLTLPATSSSNVSATVTGWAVLRMQAGSAGNYITLQNSSVAYLSMTAVSVGTSDVLTVYVPVANGQTLYVRWATGMTLTKFGIAPAQAVI